MKTIFFGPLTSASEVISALNLASQVKDDAVFPIVQDDGNYKVTMKVLKEYFKDSTIVLFDAVDNTNYIPTANTIQGSATPEDGATIETVYVKYMNDFLQKKTMANGYVYYYTVLPNASDFKDGGIRQDKLFFSVKDKSFFVYNGVALVDLFGSVRIHVLTEEDFENLENPQEGNFYATYED